MSTHTRGGGSQFLCQKGIQEMDQQVTVFLTAQQGFENTINLGVYGVLHGGGR
jgi:hypothetical protein